MDTRPLIVTGDELMLDDLLRVAAAAGVEVAHHGEVGAGSAWRSAPIVLLDDELVSDALDARLAMRRGVVAVGRQEPDAGVLKQCLQLGVERTATLGADDAALIDLLAGTLAGGPGDGPTVAVVPACGGAGASVFASALAAMAGRAGRSVILADCDPWGSGLDVLLGIEDQPGIRWDELAAPAGRLPPDALHDALPKAPFGRGRIRVLCQGRTPGHAITEAVVDAVMEAGRRSGDLTVFDLPRHPTVAADRVLEQADRVVLVTTADVRGCYAAARTADRLTALGVQPELVVRGPSPGGIGAEDIGDVLGLPVLARMRPQPSLARDLEKGKPPGADSRGPLARAARSVLAQLPTAVG
ncbi:helicase/secretion neighborhood CpaE-like protein [Nakamurella panacisegetis]|uniref:Helicase/secretion neighborhood CpaE-like protein n=1 Tax=Nakamurella panacisegetis TaxID=1090615 RepID=A0A1H0N9F3_9ACTN|nr:septum site-determining protein Ssd [Nakamurella panacisegetis]SDO89364.1 helicase/secretion neighborhood CpaE-like protein [Nakamurella panacisegetis]